LHWDNFGDLWHLRQMRSLLNWNRVPQLSQLGISEKKSATQWNKITNNLQTKHLTKMKTPRNQLIKPIKNNH